MSPAAIDDLHGVVIPDSQTAEKKKHKRDKSGHKKRAREEDEAAVIEETPRKSKKSKSEKLRNTGTEELQFEEPGSGKKKKKKKNKHGEHAVDGEDAGISGEVKKKSKKDRSQPTEESKARKKSKKYRSEDKAPQDDKAHPANPSEKKKKRKHTEKPREEQPANPEIVEDLMEVDTPHASPKRPPEDIFPFYTQTLSLYIPFFPIGFNKPLTNVAAQHLDPLLNHYSSILKGVLVSYSNLNLSERPAKASTTNPPTDDTPALVRSVDEYAVGFGRLTFDAQIFIPGRGKWMEGAVQLQNEGHVGVVCWNKFNASIEAKRLPKGWKWMDLAKAGKTDRSDWDDKDDEPAQQSGEDVLDGEELQVVEQMHTTGYWVNERGRKVSGKLRFRIKNFDVGLAGDYGYLSIEGTCLDDDAEHALVAEERKKERRRRAAQNPHGLLRPLSRRVPEFSMTKLGREDEEEDSGKRRVVYMGSRPGTPDD